MEVCSSEARSVGDAFAEIYNDLSAYSRLQVDAWLGTIMKREPGRLLFEYGRDGDAETLKANFDWRV